MASITIGQNVLLFAQANKNVHSSQWIPTCQKLPLSSLNFFITLSIATLGLYYFQPRIIIICIPHSTISPFH